MNKLTLMFGIGALALASCSNDDLVVNPTVDETANATIGFAVSSGNMSRAATQLSTEHWDFGVWAYKSKGVPSAGNLATVMDNYLVGFWDITNTQGYKPLNSQVLLGSNISDYAWYYEGLGNLQAGSWTDEFGKEKNSGL